LIFLTGWMLMEVPVVTNTPFHTIRQTVKMEAVNAVETPATYCTATRMGVVAEQYPPAEYLNILGNYCI
jgi:hypothetical protein